MCRDLERGYPGGELGEGQAGRERENLLQLREKRGHLCVIILKHVYDYIGTCVCLYWNMCVIILEYV